MKSAPENPIRHPRTLEKTAYAPFGRYKLTIAFDGSNYGGWQVQPNSLTVQEVMQKVLSRLYNKLPIFLIGSSRTDAGVHATGFCAGFLIPERPYLSPEELKDALNRLLPRDIRVSEIAVVPTEFHARYDALGKAYTYVLNLGDETPFSNRYSFHPRRRLDVEKMRQASEVLTGKNDFASFVCCAREDEDTVRTIHRIAFRQFGRYLCISYVGDGFLYKMIRCLTGALLAAGEGKLDVPALRKILAARNRSLAPTTASPQGLFLCRVFYDEKEMHDWNLAGAPFML